MRQLNFLDELIIDNFAGGGGASCGIELATGRPVDIAITTTWTLLKFMANCKWLCDKSCNNMKEFNTVAAG